MKSRDGSFVRDEGPFEFPDPAQHLPGESDTPRCHALHCRPGSSSGGQSTAILPQCVCNGAQESGPLLGMFLQMGMVRAPISEILRGDARRSLFGKIICPVVSECKVTGLVKLDFSKVAFDLY